MVDFIGSLNKGISAAQKSEENREEISSVFRTLNEQLSKAFEGKLEISTYSKTNPFSSLVGETKPAYLFIGAVNPSSNSTNPKELAKWKVDANGYPCQIQTPDNEIYCENKEGLERGLQELLSSPVVGETIYALLKLPVKPKPD